MDSAYGVYEGCEASVGVNIFVSYMFFTQYIRQVC